MTKKKIILAEKEKFIETSMEMLGPKIPKLFEQEPFHSLNQKLDLSQLIEELIGKWDSLKSSGFDGVYYLIANIIPHIKDHFSVTDEIIKDLPPVNLIYQSFLRAENLLHELNNKHNERAGGLFKSERNSAGPYLLNDAIGSYYFVRELTSCLGKDEFLILKEFYKTDLRRFRDLLETLKENGMQKWMKIDTENKRVSIKSESKSSVKISTNLFEPIRMDYEQLRIDVKNISEGVFERNEIIAGIELQIIFLDYLIQDFDLNKYLRLIYDFINAELENENETSNHVHALFCLMGVEIIKNNKLTPLTTYEEFNKNYSEPDTRYRQIQKREVKKAISLRK